jgi:hypothetical protein
MAKAPEPITSPPPVPGQPYDATVSGPGRPSQSAPTQVYDADGGSASAEAWPKIQEAGAANWATGHIDGGWPGNGTSDAAAWKQC